MTHRRNRNAPIQSIRLMAVCAGFAVVFSGCSGAPTPDPGAPEDSASKPASTVPGWTKPDYVQALTALRDSGATLGSLDLQPLTNYARVTRNGEPQLVMFDTELGDPISRDWDASAHVGWAVADPVKLGSQIDRYVEKCPAEYEIRVQAVTASAYSSMLRCGVGTEWVEGSLNQERLPALSGTWTVQDWQHLIAEWTTMSASQSFQEISSFQGSLTTTMAGADSTHTCAVPEVDRYLDGSYLYADCVDGDNSKTFSIKGITAEMLADATSKAVKELGDTTGSEVNVSLLPSESGGILFEVRNDEGKHEQIVKP